MSSLFFFLFLFPISTHLLTLSTAQPDFLYNICDNASGNYTANSTYRTNLNRALSPINSQSTINNGFYTRSSGTNTSVDTAHVVGLCRGDVKPSDCHSCLNDSTLQLTHQCPNQKEAIGWYDNCMLRYSNRSIFGAMETQNSIIFFNQNNVTTNVAQFDGLVSELLTSLADRAAAGGSRTKFATGNVSGPNAETIYGLVQCTPDLSLKACNSCLSESIGELPEYLGGRIGGRIIGPSCNFRYEIRLFYNITSADEVLTLPPEPAPAPAPAPAHAELPPSTPPIALAPVTPNAAPPSTNRTETGGGEIKTSWTIVGTTLVVALIIAVIGDIF